jgi:hypothetical protein
MKYCSSIVLVVLNVILLCGCVSTSPPERSLGTAPEAELDAMNEVFLECSIETGIDTAIYSSSLSQVKKQIKSVCSPQANAVINLFIGHYGEDGRQAAMSLINETVDRFAAKALDLLQDKERRYDRFAGCLVETSSQALLLKNPQTEAEIRKVIDDNTDLCYGKHLKAMLEPKNNKSALARRKMVKKVYADNMVGAVMDTLAEARQQSEAQTPPPEQEPHRQTLPKRKTYSI